jgi:hypothetical protein
LLLSSRDPALAFIVTKSHCVSIVDGGIVVAGAICGLLVGDGGIVTAGAITVIMAVRSIVGNDRLK